MQRKYSNNASISANGRDMDNYYQTNDVKSVSRSITTKQYE